MEIPQLLHSFLEIRRPSSGKGAAKASMMIQKFISQAGYTSYEDPAGNIIVTTDFNAVLYSCHFDTMHRGEGIQRIIVDDYGIVTAWQESCDQNGTQEKRTILGADDACGIFIMLTMIDQGIDGTYVFHADEEVGCLGSTYIASHPDSLDGYDLTSYTTAVAFDRKGTSDLINNQLCTPMASNEASVALCGSLNKDTSLNYKPADGVVTDVAMYETEIPEIFNLSVGYYDEHTNGERLDWNHLKELTTAILTNPGMFYRIPIVRVPELPSVDDHLDYDVVKPDTIEHLCNKHPDAIARLLESFSYDYVELLEVLIIQEGGEL